MDEYSVVLFDSPSHALRAEKVLKGAGFDYKLIPTPRQLSSDCGIALRFAREYEARIAETLRENRVPAAGIRKI
jgi:uncharacterized SAM-binding protein YcdF (DUF218 family)